jgi:hypothetical protein
MNERSEIGALPTDERPKAAQFKRRRVMAQKPVAGYEAYVAIWMNDGRGEVMIGAPTLDALALRWQQITRSSEAFDRARAQHVVLALAADAKVEPW